ncbi:Fumarate hydratase class II [Spirochaeta thermophila DSM 6578]|uniref:Fumarate hydratase class II n=1 Tax=Winmispira thermophila (strain ATCC 700085 / DSM 6578 / Z-1203) TaxID=869211 RepID=G0GF17_WINT7|nr:class II fumarate hydratase [Spirochaeta thermophila]AEJ62361.1 Fumarate hydratase class II [Spirochaeta thermophila DSM 6578]
MDHRIETDTMGEVRVPASAYWGAQTQRSLENFPIGEDVFPPLFIQAYAHIKKAAARANESLGVLESRLAEAICVACDEIIEGRLLDQFPLKVWQTGSGTQTNMNLNEVIANRANELLGNPKGSKSPVHPNDHVNRSQSSNDTFPAAMHLSTLMALNEQIYPALDALITTLSQKVEAFKEVVKVGRTHLQDAVPLTLGQEFSGYLHQVRSAREALSAVTEELCELPLGGTAVGTGINAPEGFTEKACAYLREQTHLLVRPARNRYALIAAHDVFASLAGSLSRLAAALYKIASDIRLMGSGPRCGLGELILPANEPGSSIMPGKVNPTQAEALTMVCIQVMGLSQAVTFACSQGHLELNTYKPLIIHDTLLSIRLLSDAVESFRTRCLEGLRPDTRRIEEYLEKTLMLVTALTPKIGYERAAQVAKKAYEERKTLKQAAHELGYLTEEEFDQFVDPKGMV